MCCCCKPVKTHARPSEQQVGTQWRNSARPVALRAPAVSLNDSKNALPIRPGVIIRWETPGCFHRTDSNSRSKVAAATRATELPHSKATTLCDGLVLSSFRLHRLLEWLPSFRASIPPPLSPSIAPCSIPREGKIRITFSSLNRSIPPISAPPTTTADLSTTSLSTGCISKARAIIGIILIVPSNFELLLCVLPIECVRLLRESLAPHLPLFEFDLKFAPMTPRSVVHALTQHRL